MISNGAWQADAACATTDPEFWFPETAAQSRAAKKICAGCDVQDQCNEIADPQWGIWGGLTRSERRKIAA